MVRNTSRALVGMVLSVLMAPASAVLMEVTWDTTQSDSFGGFPAPQTFSTTLLFDLDASTPGLGGHPAFALVSGVTSVGGDTYSATGGRVSYQDQIPTVPPVDRIIVSGTFAFALGPVDVLSVSLALEGPETAFGAADIPFLPNLAEFTTAETGVRFASSICPDPGCLVTGSAENIQIRQVGAVPEPSVLALVMLGGLALAISARRSRA